MKKYDAAIIGYGNWGVSLTHALTLADVHIREIVVRRRSSGSRLPLVTKLPFVTWTKAALDASMLWICVPDDEIAGIAERIAERRGSLKGQIVLHSSGALTTAALAAARSAGAAVGAVHPVMTFPTRRPVPLTNVLFGIEAAPALGLRLAAMVRKLGGRPFSVDTRRKALYHAAGTLSSPLLVSALAAAMEAARLAGVPEPAAFVQALAEATITNVFARGPQNSFSGPFARGDVRTIELHLQALAPHPMLNEVYRSLGLFASNSLPVAHRSALNAALKRVRN